MYCPNPDCPDRSATGRPSEYRDEIHTCPVCGTRLERGSWDDLEPTVPRSREVPGEVTGVDVELLRTGSTQEADIVASVLDEERIPFWRRVEGPDGSLLADGAALVLPGMEQVLLVPESHLHRARLVMEDVLRAEPVFEDEGPFPETEEETGGGIPEPPRAHGGVGALIVRAVVLALLLLGFVAVLRIVFGAG